MKTKKPLPVFDSVPDPFLDSEEIAEKIREARRGKYRPHDPKEYDRILQRVIAKRTKLTK